MESCCVDGVVLRRGNERRGEMWLDGKEKEVECVTVKIGLVVEAKKKLKEGRKDGQGTKSWMGRGRDRWLLLVVLGSVRKEGWATLIGLGVEGKEGWVVLMRLGGKGEEVWARGVRRE